MTCATCIFATQEGLCYEYAGDGLSTMITENFTCKKYVYSTCSQCVDKDDCDYSGDLYNTNGDCLWEK